MSLLSGDLRNRPPGRAGTHFPVTLISSPILDGSARNGARGSAGRVNGYLRSKSDRSYQPECAAPPTGALPGQVGVNHPGEQLESMELRGEGVAVADRGVGVAPRS